MKIITPIPIQLGNKNGVNSLKIWADASKKDSIVELSGSVSRFSDLSGNDNHFLQAVGADQPTTNATTQNGLNVIDFARGNVMLSNYVLPEDDFTVFFVGKSETSASFDFMLSQTSSATVEDWSLIKQNTDFYYAGFDSGTIGASSGIQAPNPIVLTLTNSRVSSTNTFTLYKNGVSVGTLQIAFGGSSTGIVLGGKLFSARGRFEGWVGEIIIYNRLFDTNELNLMYNSYLNPKWAIA